MRFEARDLKPYAEPIKAHELRVGEIYFAVQHVADSDLKVPIVEPLEFLGRNLHAQDVDQLYFRPLASVDLLNAFGHTEPHYYRTTPNELQHVFHFERALDQLLVCSLRRAGHDTFNDRPEN